MPILLQLLPIALYAMFAAYLARTRWQSGPATMAPNTPQPLTWLERGGLLAMLLVHGVVVHRQMLQGETLHFGFANALSLMMWLALVFYWVESFYTRLEGLLALALPLAALCALMPVMWPEERAIAASHSPIFRLHFFLAMLAYSLFTLAAMHALLMSASERQLHQGRVTRALAALPPLLTLEALLFRLISLAFALLTATLLSGVVFSEELFGRAFPFNHKTIFAIASWVVFAILLVGRHLRGWRGRKALRWTMGGFLFLMLAYVGMRFVVEVLLGRS